MKIFKLTDEERDDLFSLKQHEGLNVLFKVMEQQATDMDKAVLSLQVSSEMLPELGYRKARAEGAWTLLRRLNLFLEEQSR